MKEKILLCSGGGRKKKERTRSRPLPKIMYYPMDTIVGVDSFLSPRLTREDKQDSAREEEGGNLNFEGEKKKMVWR